MRQLRSAFCFHIGEERLRRCDNLRLCDELGGGALLDVGCYSVSLARWLLGAEPELVQAQARYNAHGIDIHFAGLMRFPGDVLASLEASFICALQQTYTVVGERGAIELPHDAFIPWEREAAFRVRGCHDEHGERLCLPAADQYQLMVEHFADALRGKTPLIVPPEESVLNMKVLDALARAARTGESVRV
ncbi:MAG: gfo/Idh/MocA family oxidoreductase [Alphaproteobacteria bacterium]|nr:MAG: gfo/Idh/MocA family oxidoreductase [Alphaproteobacteria bacterium]